MSSKTLCSIVRIAVIAVAGCGFIACYYLPSYGSEIANNNPEFAHCYIPWLVFLWLAAAPCFAFLVLIWKVSTAIKNETVFSFQTARIIKACAMILFGNAAFFFIGNIVFMLLGMNHPSVLLLSIIIDVFGLSLAVLIAVLSRYLTKAAALQEEADGTI